MNSIIWLWEIVVGLWNTANYFTRLAILIIVGWPIVMILLAVTVGVGMSAAAIIPAVALIALLIARLDPMVIALIAAFGGEKVIRWLFTIIGLELTVGFYFSVIPVKNDPELLFLLILAVLTFLFLTFGIQKKMPSVGLIKFAMVITIIVITIIFYFGGREKIKERGITMGTRPSSAPPFTTQGHIEDGYWVAPESLVAKPHYETRDVKQELRDNQDVRITTNCRDPVIMMTLAPGESVQIRHVDYGEGWEWKNRCSYSANGGAIPIYGEEGKVNRPRFRYDLPYPDVPAGAIGFSLEDAKENEITHDYIKNSGGIIYLHNTSGKDVNVMLRYNYMKAFTQNPSTKIQIGYDGSTATFMATRFTKK